MPLADIPDRVGRRRHRVEMSVLVVAATPPFTYTIQGAPTASVVHDRMIRVNFVTRFQKRRPRMLGTAREQNPGFFFRAFLRVGTTELPRVNEK